MENISKNITYGEAVFSPTAKSKRIDNTPTKEILEKMTLVADNVFEKIREHFKKPIKVSSFYRSVKLNKAIGGVAHSQHCLGEALDMDGDVYGMPSNKEIFEFIRDYIEFDQVIIEGIHGGKMDWVHCSYKKEGNRNKILFMYKDKNRKTVYEEYTLQRYHELIK